MFHRISKVKSAGILILALAVALSLSGCGKNKNESGPDSLLNVSSGSEKSENLSAERESVEFEAKLSYANSSYIDTGDDSEDKMIRNVKQTLTAEDSDEKLQIEALIEALKTVPKGLSDAETFVSDDVTVNSMKFSGSSLIIDLSSDGLDELGMYDEKYFVYQITDSVLNTFSYIEGVRFTIDGAKKDSMNYIDISSPFTSSEVKGFLNGSSTSSEEKEDSTETKAATEKTTEKTTDKTTKGEDSESEDSKKTDSNSSKSSSQTNTSSSSSSGSSSSDNQTSETKKNTSSNNTSSSTSGSKNNSSSGSQSSTSGSSSSSNGSTSGNQSSSSGSSASGNKSTSSSGSQSSSSGSSTSGSNNSSSSSGSQKSSSGSQKSSSGSSGTSSGSSSSKTTQDGVVNDDDL